MKNKKAIYLLLMSLCIGSSITACKNKVDDTKNNINITLPSNETETNPETSKPKVASSSNTEEIKENIIKEENNKNNDLQTKINQIQVLDDFLIQLQLLQEQNLLDIYNIFNIGDSNKSVREGIDSAGYRYINNVKLGFLYDDSLSLIDMGGRKGLIVFTKSNLKIDDEVKKITRIENFAEANNEDIIINVENKDFDSFIVFTFNEDNVLVGKFKYLLSENGNKKNIDILGGDLTYDINIPLQISETADTKTIYEKLDLVRTEKEKLDKEYIELETKLLNNFETFYDKIVENIEESLFLKIIKDSDLEIEKMNSIGLKKYNDRFSTNNELGYYVFLGENEKQTSPDLRYNNTYMTFVFDKENKLYYKSIIDKNIEKEECKDIKKAEDYSLKEVYDEYLKLEENINNFKEQKKTFYSYLEKNLVFLNSRINFDYTYEDVISEIKNSGLDFILNYDNQVITQIKDKDGNTLNIMDELGNKIYDNCIKVTSNIRDIYYFFNQNNLVGIYRSDYFDISELSMNDYMNLTTIKKGLNNLLKEEENIKKEMKLNQNIIDSKLKIIIDSICFSNKKEENKITKRKDILNVLDNSGFKYEEGMNKGDGLYFVGIFANKNDTKYAYKIYFNELEEVELIQ